MKEVILEPPGRPGNVPEEKKPNKDEKTKGGDIMENKKDMFHVWQYYRIREAKKF